MKSCVAGTANVKVMQVRGARRCFEMSGVYVSGHRIVVRHPWSVNNVEKHLGMGIGFHNHEQ